MDKIRLLILIISGLIPISGLLILQYYRDSIARDNFGTTVASKIAPGMSHDQIVAIVGKVPGDYSTCETINLDPYFIPYPFLVCWRDNTTGIGVLYDDEGRVIGVFSEKRTPLKDFMGFKHYWIMRLKRIFRL